MTIGRMLGVSNSPRATPKSTPVGKKKKFGFLVNSSTDSDTDKSWNAPELDIEEKKRRKKLLKKGVTAADIKLVHSPGPSCRKVEIIKSVQDISDEGEGGEREVVRVRGMSVRRVDNRRSPRSRRRVRSEAVRRSIKSDWSCPPEWNMDPNQVVHEESPPPLPPKNVPLRHSESPYVPPLPPKSVKQQGVIRKTTDHRGGSPEWDSSPSPEDWDRPLPPAKSVRPSPQQRPELPPKARNQPPPALPPKTAPSLPPKQTKLTSYLPPVDTLPPTLPPKIFNKSSERPPALPPKSRETNL